MSKILTLAATLILFGCISVSSKCVGVHYDLFSKDGTYALGYGKDSVCILNTRTNSTIERGEIRPYKLVGKIYWINDTSILFVDNSVDEYRLNVADVARNTTIQQELRSVQEARDFQFFEVKSGMFGLIYKQASPAYYFYDTFDVSNNQITPRINSTNKIVAATETRYVELLKEDYASNAYQINDIAGSRYLLLNASNIAIHEDQIAVLNSSNNKEEIDFYQIIENGGMELNFVSRADIDLGQSGEIIFSEAQFSPSGRYLVLSGEKRLCATSETGNKEVICSKLNIAVFDTESKKIVFQDMQGVDISHGHGSISFQFSTDERYLIYELTGTNKSKIGKTDLQKDG